jgi:poly(3-hydroxybutyrate) depolymerase
MFLEALLNLKENIAHRSFPPIFPDIGDYQEMSLGYYLKDWTDVAKSPLHQASLWAQTYAQSLSSLLPFNSQPSIPAILEVFERQTRSYSGVKPSFNISEVISSAGNTYTIEEEVVCVKPFCQLLHFKKQPLTRNTTLDSEKFPTILIVAPYSGHYSTLLRDTCRSFLKDHDVYITDWINSREVPLKEGNFFLEDYIQYLIDFIHLLQRDLHIVAVCQPAVPVLATVAILAQHKDPLQPRSMILMGGPIDTRINPTAVNRLAKAKPLQWFSRNVIARVPWYYRGAFRRVCPGFLMLSGFMSLNLDRHLQASRELYKHLVQGDQESAEAHRKFYDEYRSVLDLPADYFLDSVRVAFQEHCLPKGQMTWKGERVDPLAIQSTAILAVEGEKDDISGVGQTQAALYICENVPAYLRQYHLQKGVGHYGVFNGHRFREEIVPIISKFIREKRAPVRIVKSVS